jgi:uncharacterized protein
MSSFLVPILGGALIGLGAALLWLTLGRIAGVSGLLNASLGTSAASATARAFIAGLLIAGAALHFVASERFGASGAPSLPALVLAGLLVGFGTRLGNGCTSGHGVCGIARGSKRSIAATATFILFAAMTVYVARHAT